MLGICMDKLEAHKESATLTIEWKQIWPATNLASLPSFTSHMEFCHIPTPLLQWPRRLQTALNTGKKDDNKKGKKIEPVFCFIPTPSLKSDLPVIFFSDIFFFLYFIIPPTKRDFVFQYLGFTKKN